MRLTGTSVQGAFLIDFEPVEDDRGFFARAFCARELGEHGLHTKVAQCNLVLSRRAGTLRGLHYQASPSSEAKLVRCVRGAIHDVLVDLRPESPTYLAHVGVELTAANRRALYAPPLCAHGYQALEDDTEVFYQCSDFYRPDLERGLRYDDPALGIRWPLPVTDVSDKDRRWPPLTPASPGDRR